MTTGSRAGVWEVAFIGSTETEELMKDRGKKQGVETSLEARYLLATLALRSLVVSRLVG